MPRGRPRKDAASDRPPPKEVPRRFISLSPGEQRGIAIAYAVAVVEHRAWIDDPHYVSTYREMYVRIDGRRWMVPQRFLRTARRAREWAEAMAADPPSGEYAIRIAVWLRRLHRRSICRPVAVPATIDRRYIALRGSQAPSRSYLARHLAAMRRRQEKRDRREAAISRSLEFARAIGAL